MNIHLRLETPDDHNAVEAMTRDAFWTFWETDRKVCDEHLLVSRLRTAQGYVPELNCVAEIDGKLAGHIIYTKSKIVDDGGNEYATLTFGPLTVAPEFQSRGVGKALIRHTADVAQGLGYRAVLIYGHPDYYPRAGFRRAAEFGIITPDGKSFDALMALPLYDGALDGVSGRYYIDPAYEGLTQEDALEFDKRFPPKAPYIPASISVLLDRLSPEAKSAIAAEGWQTLEFIRSKSQREIASLPGIDDAAVEAIRAALRERGYRWGEA